ncbi:MAG TPA: T9SS type A sorting domain-containing protein [Luteibaculaceae bacterium]|nr:T9SS type A sorting domain-containing protein [Luteibaculaceae bacterium]
MKTSSTLQLIALMAFWASVSQAQPWMKGLPPGDENFYEIKTAFENHWQGRSPERGKGYKSFKRWEWFWEQRVAPTGEFPPADIRYTEWQKYQVLHPENELPPHMKAATWTFKGPNSSNGGYSGIGRVNCVAFHPTNAQVFWIGTPAGGIWKTTNGGSSWTTSTDRLPVLGVTDIAVDPSSPNTLYAATGDGDGGDTYSIGILKSTDGGSTWSVTGLNWNVTSQKRIRRMQIDKSSPSTLLVAASDGIWRSTDAANTWVKVQSGGMTDIEFNPTNSSIVYAASYGFGNAQIFRSTNNGASWTQVTSFSGIERINLAVSEDWPMLVDALCADQSGGLAGLWYSDNAGASFTNYYDATCENNMLNYAADGVGCGGQGWYDLAYTINPADANEIYLGGINTWRTLDGGASWELNNIWSNYFTQAVPEVHADKHFLAFHPLNAAALYECNDGGIYRTTNGGQSWTDLSNGLGISQIYRIGTSKTVANNVICGLQDNGSKELKNNSMVDRTGGDGMECIIDYTNAAIQYATYVNGEIYKTTNGWSSYTTIVNNNGTGADEPGNWVTPYIMHPTNNQTLLLGKSQVYKTTNGGTSWTQLGQITGMTGKLVSMAYAPSDPNTIYVASAFEVFKSTNGGTTWTKIRQSSNSITYLAVDPANAQNIFITCSGYSAGNKVFITTNGGTNWTNYSGTLPNVPVNCVVYQNMPNDKGIFIGTDLGVYYRGTGMSDWLSYNNGLPNVVVNELEISYNNNKLWAATYGRGLWNSDLYSSVGISEAELSQSIGLSPNPNQGDFTIDMAEPMAYSIKVTDILGKEILSQSNIRSTHASFSLAGAHPGVYLVVISIGDNTITKKMVVQ